MTSTAPRRSKRDDEPDWHARVVAWVERTCAEQGVPVKVTDRLVVRQVADILREANAREEDARKGTRAA